MTFYQKHVEAWSGCRRCSLHESRTRVVLARGSLPCDILFVGEAPGPSEDVLGRPFVGPAGHLLDEIIRMAVPKTVSYALTNLVACIPRDEDSGRKFAEPPEEAIEACSVRLNKFVRICKPRVLILVGALAKKHIYGQSRFGDCEWLNGNPMRFTEIIHPAAILRMDVSRQGLAIQRCVVAVEDMVSTLRGSV
jgi:uracil-DNA glycosylase